jgi:hypothetical protein
VGTAIEAEPRARRFGGFVVPALLATAATVALVTILPREPEITLVSPVPMAASAALPAVDEGAEAGIDVLAECPDVAACVASLTDEESRELADALRAELSGDL